MKNYSIYKPIKEKSNVVGFWFNNGKIYKDRLKLIPYSEKQKELLFWRKEIAVFYCDDYNAICENVLGYKNEYRNKHVIHFKKINRSLILKYLYIYKGLTIYRNKTLKDYTLEIWQ
jgi:hypothetical protein